jgi:LysM repeat protein
MILTVHVVVISGMLLQGCKDVPKEVAKQDSSVVPSGDTTAASTTTTTPPVQTGAPVDMPTTVNPNISNAYAGTAASAAPMTPPSTPMTGVVPPAKSTDLAVPASPSEGKEYVIVRGDTLAAIAHKNGVSLKALTEANPGANPKKLQIGQKLQIPGGTASMAATSGASVTPSAGSDATPTEGSVYVVKSGDTLTKIAKTHGTSFKKIMAMNDLKSTSIRAGQKLKMPAKASTTEPASAAPATAPASASAMPTAPAMKVSAATPTTTSPVAAN